MQWLLILQECQHKNVTDIDGKKIQNEGREEYTQVTIMLLPDMVEDWKEKYNKKRDECKSKETTML